MPMNDYMAHNTDYHLYYPAHQCVITDILTAISVNGWTYQCMSSNQSMYASMYYIQSYIFHFIPQIILIVLLMVK